MQFMEFDPYSYPKLYNALNSKDNLYAYTAL